MNHIYKLVWCAASNCWVAVSELATGVRKNTTKAAKALIIAPLAAASSLAIAAPVEIVGGNYTAPIPMQEGPEFLVKDTKVTIDSNTYTGSGVMQGTYFLGNDIETKVDIHNYALELTGTGTSITAFTGLEARATNGIEINLSGNNKITLDHQGADTAILASTWTPAPNKGNGSATINIQGTLDILNKGTKDNYERDGVEVNAYNGNAIINHTGSGKIETEAGNAIFAKQREGDGNIKITLNSSLGKDAIELLTHGNSNVNNDQWLGHHGISAAIYSPNNNGTIDILSNAKITTEGDLAKGIYSQHKGFGDNNITNLGTISTSGKDSQALYAYNDNALSDGKITILNEGDLTTSGKTAHGIFAENKSSGKTIITNIGDININGANTSIEGSAQSSFGIFVKNSSAQNGNDIAVTNSGRITTAGYDNAGIRIVNLNKTGNINVASSGNINVNGENSDGIFASTYTDKSESNISITTTGGNITIGDEQTTEKMSNNFGIVAFHEKAETTGNITIETNGTNITTNQDKNNTANLSSTIYAGILNASATGNIVVRQNKGNFLTYGTSSHGVLAWNKGLGGIQIRTAGDIITNGNNSHGVYALIDNTESTEKISITNLESLTTKGSSSYGIFAENKGKGAVTVTSEARGTITTEQNNSHGIYVANSNLANDKTIKIDNSSNISTKGSRDADGIRVSQKGIGGVSITNRGEIKTSGQQSETIYVESDTKANIEIDNYGDLYTENSIAVTGLSKGEGDVSIKNNANITASNKISDPSTGKGTNSAHGLQAISKEGLARIDHESGTITVKNEVNNHSAHGIAAWGADSTSTTSRAIVNVGEDAVVDASRANSAIFLITTGDGGIGIDHNAKIIGGKKDAAISFGIANNGQNEYDITNDGHISALSDHAIKISGSKATSELELINSGTIQGYVTSTEKTALNMTNTGKFLVRSQDGVTKKVAISQFNSGFINNDGLIELMSVNGLVNDKTNEYVPSGAMSTEKEGIVQGQLLDVKNFNHSGVLDLRGSGLSGNVLVISGAQTAGTNGNGHFTSNGGVMKVATTLNEGGAASRSDMLVVDNLKKGSDSTKIDLTIAAGSSDVKTVGNGIQIVKTLGSQDSGAFDLLTPVTYGRYEYLLFSNNAAGVADGYYLRNKLINPVKPPIYLPNPNIGAYLGNQYAAANMFNQNILDRRDNVQSPDQTVWGRINYNENKADHMSGTQKLKSENTLLQVGADFYRNDEKGHIAGAYFGYGQSDITNTSYLTGSKAEGDVRGLQIGGYYSWVPEQDQGPYVDVWGHYANYRSKLKGKAQKNHDKKYDGYGFALSAEGGYSFVLNETDVNKWILKPHLQLTYSYLNMDDFTDSNNTRFSDNKSNGIQTRLGARFYGFKKQDNNGVLPFVEANWLHNGMSNEIAVNGHKESSKLGKNVGEIKLGIQGNITKSSSIFVHVGFQKGDHSYKRTTGQIGYNYNWK